MIQSRIEQLQTEIELTDPAVETVESTATGPSSNRVFVVHGHHHGRKETVARFLEKLGLEPVILHEKPNAGRTLIEKFSDYANVYFAVVLLTADDIGRGREEPDPPRPRARLNVILKLGYFLGKLGRHRVCAGPSNNQIEPPRLPSCAIMSPRGAAHLARWADSAPASTEHP
jgi:predicted nucleotide-binding protein